METLLTRISELQRSEISRQVRARMSEFKRAGQESDDAIFKEMCFCLLTANYSSEGGIRIQKAIGDGFLTLSQTRLAAKLKSLGYRFPNARARYIVEARKHRRVKDVLRTLKDPHSMRKYLADNVLGLGFKESSHFLRNIGYSGLAIIDFHIIALLVGHGLIEKPKSSSLSRKKYLETEAVLQEICRRSGTSQGELDLYLWYLETGKILK
jgi:N-glycosylase/DNA lyase